MLPEKTEFLKVMANVYDKMKAARRRTVIVYYDELSAVYDEFPALLVRSKFAFKLTYDQIHMGLLRAEREADRMKP